MDGIKLEVWREVVIFSKERYNPVKCTSTPSRQVSSSSLALLNLIDSTPAAQEEVRIRDRCVSQGTPVHDVWFVNLDPATDLYLAVSYYKGKNMIHVRRYEGEERQPSQDGVTFSLKGLKELRDKKEIITDFLIPVPV